MNVVSLKLIDGSELIAELVKSQQGVYIIRRPLAVVPMRSQNGSVQIGFALWSMIIDQDQEIYIPETSVIAFPLDVNSEVAANYMQEVTGIAVPVAGTGKILQG